ncbi:MAG: hypothetical protein QOH26_636 [Actinomycetota bacterium]|jgi:hypothetical protein|nr:hypothetical protein [Actinomycetota bacterium]
MTDSEVEQVLLGIKRGEDPRPPTSALTSDEAIAYRNAGNVPDEHGRVLRLFLQLGGETPGGVDERRFLFEADFHEAPLWRREGSRPVNVIPLGLRPATSDQAWWEEPLVAELEAGWTSSGEIEGVQVPAAYRGFVYKTVIALRRAGIKVGVDTISNSAARWLPAAQAEELRSALASANAIHTEEPGP